MLFSSYPFLLLFLPVLLLVWFKARGLTNGARTAVLFLASLVFYTWSGSAFLWLLLAMALANWQAGLALAEPEVSETPGGGRTRRRLSRKALLGLMLAADFLPLLYCKYTDFFSAAVASLAGTDPGWRSPGLPLGISFYTFIQTAWLVSVYRREIVPGPLAQHALFSSFFGYVVSGPIVRWQDMGPQLSRLAPPGPADFARGLSLFVMGLAKKVILADSIAAYANAVFNAAEKGWPVAGPEAWFGAFAYAMQLYFDFSGYTDMALGAGLMLGLTLPFNFDSPYKSTGIVDFWRRWHITLGTWLRDFLYIPLGGNRRGKICQYRNLFLTMLIGGAWHGAGWTFIIWGALHGAMLCVNHFFRALTKGTPVQVALAKAPCRAGFILLTFVCVTLCWVVFRAQSAQGALAMYQAMASLPDASQGLFPHGYVKGWLPHALLGLCVGICWLLPNSQELIFGRRDGASPALRWKPSAAWAAGLALAAVCSLVLASREATFLYFQF